MLTIPCQFFRLMILLVFLMSTVISNISPAIAEVGSTRLRVPVIVRTINLWEHENKKDTPYYAKRMAIIASLVHRDGLSVRQNNSPGLIGLQEVKVGMTACQAQSLSNRKPNGAKCFAALLSERYKGRTVYSTNRAIVYGDDFRKIASANFDDIGPGRERRNYFTVPYDRTLREAFSGPRCQDSDRLKIRYKYPVVVSK